MWLLEHVSGVHYHLRSQESEGYLQSPHFQDGDGVRFLSGAMH